MKTQDKIDYEEIRRSAARAGKVRDAEEAELLDGLRRELADDGDYDTYFDERG